MVILLLTYKTGFALESIKVSSFLENEESVIEAVFVFDVYSIYLSDCLDTVSFSINPGFSFNSGNLKAGRIKKDGIWRELLNPFGYSAGSQVYSAEENITEDFSPGSGGDYGIFLRLPADAGFSAVFSPYLWIGVEKEVLVNESFRITGFLSCLENEISLRDEWIADSTELYLSKPVHCGIRTTTALRSVSADSVIFVSGNRYFRSEIFSRLFVKLEKKNISLDILYVFAGKDFILPGGESVEERIKIAADLIYNPIPEISLNLKSDYSVMQPEPYPSSNIGHRTGICASGVLEKGVVKSEIMADYGDRSESSGIFNRYYSINGFLKLGSPSLYLKISADREVSTEEPEKRIIHGETGISFGAVSMKAEVTASFDKFTRDCFHTEGSGKVQMHLPGGLIYISASLSDKYVLTTFRIGFQTEDGLNQIPRKNLAVSK